MYLTFGMQFPFSALFHFLRDPQWLPDTKSAPEPQVHSVDAFAAGTPSWLLLYAAPKPTTSPSKLQTTKECLDICILRKTLWPSQIRATCASYYRHRRG